MRTRTIIEDGLYRTEYIYRPSELSEKLKEKVCEKYRDWHTGDSWWYESAMEYWKERLEEFGFENPDVRFSGFWSQGDGASFTCDYCDGQKIINTLLICQGKDVGDLSRWRLWFELVENGPYINFKVYRHSSHYVHERSITAEVEEDYNGFQNKIFEAFDDRGRKYYTSVFDRKVALLDLQEMFSDWVRSLCKEIYTNLEKDYEYYSSDEVILECLEANDFEFDESGDRV